MGGITSIRFSSTLARRQPRPGDRRTTKKHGLQIRQPVLAKGPNGAVIGYDCTGGRQRYEWVSPAELRPLYHCYLTPEERASLGSK